MIYYGIYILDDKGQERTDFFTVSTGENVSMRADKMVATYRKVMGNIAAMIYKKISTHDVSYIIEAEGEEPYREIAKAIGLLIHDEEE